MTLIPMEYPCLKSIGIACGLALLSASPLRAQLDLTPSVQFELPISHSYILDITDYSGSKPLIALHTTDEVHAGSLTDGIWTKIGSYRSTGLRPCPESVVTTNVAGWWRIATYHNDDLVALFDVRQSPPAKWSYLFPGEITEIPRDILQTPDGRYYFID